jgi:glycosyltransferase involved in cell wall biosynthesis
VGARGVVGFREQVIPSGPEQTGLHVNGDDPSDIAWAIKEILKDPEGAKRMGEDGRERVLKYFTWRTAAEQTIDVYEKIVQGTS